MYRAWGDLPRESGWRRRFLAWMLGGWQWLLYIGITERTAVARWAEHLNEKTWAPDVACWERDPQVWHSEADVLDAERSAIIAERPVHNVAHNGNNPGAVRMRRHLPRHVVAARTRLLVRACVAVALFTVFWIAGDEVWQGWDAPRNAAIAAAIVQASAFVALARARQPRRRRR
ncbi:hypothetical protein [Micromonospora sp. RV43]|uniref:hypothetical protein n=1 Tax=Micromonospora sp. RV43 TaxID=1661387 RepID=UPI00064BBA5F|nr:hypothetical protein [Micromonospora sp. RV43]